MSCVFFLKRNGRKTCWNGRKLLPRLGAFESLYYALNLNDESCHVTLKACSDCSCDGRINDCWTAYFKQTNSHLMSFEYPMERSTLWCFTESQAYSYRICMGASICDQKHSQKHIFATNSLRPWGNFPWVQFLHPIPKTSCSFSQLQETENIWLGVFHVSRHLKSMRLENIILKLKVYSFEAQQKVPAHQTWKSNESHILVEQKNLYTLFPTILEVENGPFGD